MARNIAKINGGISKRVNYLYTQGTSGKSVAKEVLELHDESFWRIERLVRTELSLAHNNAESLAIREAARTMPDLMQRWTERVNDMTWQPLDNRVAFDSMAMHGQLAPPGGVFTMPNDPAVSTKIWGKSWPHPPNRPHDRAVLTPWRKSWGIPGWVLRNGTKVWLSR